VARLRYTEQLDALRHELTEAISVVGGSVSEVTRILLEGDLTGAESVVAADALVDERMARVEQDCFSVLALQSPVAGGLRQVLAAMRIAGEVARSGDLVVNIAKAARRVYGHRVPDTVAAAVRDMSDRAFVMFAETADACAAADGARLAVLRNMDVGLDEAQSRLMAAVFEEESANGMDPQMTIQMAVVGRFYERLGDHATIIMEWISHASGSADPDPVEAPS
jgi:phosphate transport system protein